MNTPKTLAKDFFLWAGAMVSFYWSVIAFTFLIFDYINYTFPNPLVQLNADPYQSGISYSMASIIVLFPVYVFLMSLIRKDIATDPARKELWVRRWALILTLFVAGTAIAINLITLLTTFLNGEALTTAFLLKVLVIFLVAGGVFMHFISDLRGYWDMFPARRRAVSIGVGILAAVSIFAGFFIVGTPREARLMRFDAQKVSDLQTIQYQVVSYWQAKRALPSALVELNNPLTYTIVPVDPQTSDSYRYEAKGKLTFKLCATFNAPGSGPEYFSSQPRSVSNSKMSAAEDGLWETWEHEAGDVCFERTIDPSFYPTIQ